MTEDKSGGGAGKPATQQKPPESGMEPKAPAQDAARPKPMPNNDPGAEKPSREPMGGMPPQPVRKNENDSGMGKPQGGPPPAGTKPEPKDPMPGGGDGMSEPKAAPPDAGMGKPGASEIKPDGTKP